MINFTVLNFLDLIAFDTNLILLANVLQAILHGVALITRVKISRYCNIINFSEDYFRQQYHQLAEEYGLTEAQVSEALGFYAAHQTEIDRAIAAEQAIETANV